jgi:hypothetical protein
VHECEGTAGCSHSWNTLLLLLLLSVLLLSILRPHLPFTEADRLGPARQQVASLVMVPLQL